jgi:hypothetical protein
MQMKKTFIARHDMRLKRLPLSEALRDIFPDAMSSKQYMLNSMRTMHCSATLSKNNFA